MHGRDFQIPKGVATWIEILGFLLEILWCKKGFPEKWMSNEDINCVSGDSELLMPKDLLEAG